MSKKRQRLGVDPVELAAIVERTRGVLSAEDFAQLKAALDTLAFMTAELQAKGTSLARLRKLLFGAPSEKTRTVLKGQKPSRPDAGQQQAQRPGHGRNGAAAYTGATRKKVPHASMQ